MKNRIEKLKLFIQEYGEDFLEDGTKVKTIQALNNEDTELALEILNAIEKEWLQRAKEIKKFLMFTDYTKGDNNKEYYMANYIDSLELNEKHIPVLRRIIQREREKIKFPSNR